MEICHEPFPYGTFVSFTSCHQIVIQIFHSPSFPFHYFILKDSQPLKITNIVFPSPSLIPLIPKPQALSSFRLLCLSLLAGTGLPTPWPSHPSRDDMSDQMTMGIEVPRTGHGPGNYGLRIGRRWVVHCEPRNRVPLLKIVFLNTF